MTAPKDDPASQSLSFEQMLPRLVAAYERGLLVPFIGAGMSVPVCTGWKEFITRLEQRAGVEKVGRSRKKPSSDELVRRANYAVRRLKLSGSTTFVEALSHALFKKPRSGKPMLPHQTRRLARIYWPLVLTTNYDDLFVMAWNDLNSEEEMTTVGRGAEDCHKVLASLGNPRAPLTWALQGFLPGIAKQVRLGGGLITFLGQAGRRRMRATEKLKRDRAFSGRAPFPFLWPFSFKMPEEDAFSEVQEERHLRDLRDELVVGHEEYRRVAFAQPLFRRAFAEVFRSRSLLFLGSSLGEQYFLNLFGEVLEIYGANPIPHYALIDRKNPLDDGFLRSRFNIFVHRYENHAELPGLLGELRKQIDGRAKAKSSLHFTVPLGDKNAAWKADRLRVVATDLKKGAIDDDECVLVEATRDDKGHWSLPDATRTLLEGSGLRLVDDLDSAEQEKKRVFVFGRPEGRRDMGWFAVVMEESLSLAVERGFRKIRVLWTKPLRWVSNPSRFKTVETIRAYGRCVRGLQGQPPSLTLHLTDPGLLFDLRTGRIDPNELLRCDDVRFWIEIHPADGSPLVEIYQCAEDESVLGVATAMGVPVEADWFVEASPSPFGRSPIPINLPKLGEDGAQEPKTLAALGVLPNSTLSFIQVPRKDEGDETDKLAEKLAKTSPRQKPARKKKAPPRRSARSGKS